MINFILDLKFYEAVFSFILLGISFALIILFYRARSKILISLLDIGIIIKMISILFISYFIAMFYTTIIFFIFANKPSEEFINFLKEKNIINQEYLSAYLNNDSSLIDTLGFGNCEIKNYNGKVCNEYLKYVIAKLQKEYQENLKKEQVEKQKEQIKLKEKNENIKKITDEYFLIQK
ncbi:hypothetical protein L8648_000400 [Campylobacter lari]|uniref:hypothetical protein n=1 Tax=Campylobacter lari TaxID=201 RepID=UPI0012CE2D85|nr:hypothetical protein [Campylobacter lari]EAL0061526.1 hypothetical protein [Campylobacter lari]EIV5071138.1 hypothetical protein [Campylobacter lari]MCW0239521.1 hypothetical protein [Campylobacter lari]